MIVFSDEYTLYLEGKYKNHKEYQKPYIYQLALSEEYEGFRDEIEKLISIVPLNQKKEFIERLRSDNDHSFLETRNELAIAWIMQKLEYQIEYQPKLKDKSSEGHFTPDWYIRSKNDISNFAIEVFTTSYDNANNMTDQERYKNLEGRLKELDFNNIILPIKLKDIYGKSADKDKINKRIVQQIKKYLESMDLQEDIDEESVDDCFENIVLSEDYFDLYKISRSNDGSLGVRPIIYPTVHIFDSDRLYKKVEEKIKRYKGLVEDLDLPFAICVFCDPIYGQLLQNLLNNEETGLFQKRAELSAVIWVDRCSWYVENWRIKAFHNATAERPLPEHTFLCSGE